MPDLEMRKLWKLHLVDHQLLDLRKRAAALDPGRKQQNELAAANTEHDAKLAHLKTLTSEQTDTELQQKSIDEKLKKIDKDLYGGKVVNPKEVAALEGEIANLKKRRGDLDVKLLELWEAIPPAKDATEKSHQVVKERKAALEEHQKSILKLKAQIEKEFAERSALRPQLAKEVPAALLSRYELIRQKNGGIGMAGISKKGTCEECGTNLPTKTIESAKEGRMVTCEACHRLLYFTEGLI